MKGNLSASPEFGARWRQMSGLAPGSAKVKGGTVEATARGQVMSGLPPGPQGSEGLADAPGGGGAPSSPPPPTPRPRQETQVLGHAQEGGPRAPRVTKGPGRMEETQPLLSEPSLCWRGHSRNPQARTRCLLSPRQEWGTHHTAPVLPQLKESPAPHA